MKLRQQSPSLLGDYFHWRASREEQYRLRRMEERPKVVREGKKFKRKAIPKDVRDLFRGRPCVICGGTFRMHLDHIIPVSKGGNNDPSNLQRLCWQCNLKKKDRRTNEELRAWFEGRRAYHLAKAAYEEKWQATNFYDRPRFEFKEVAHA